MESDVKLNNDAKLAHLYSILYFKSQKQRDVLNTTSTPTLFPKKIVLNTFKIYYGTILV